MKEHKLHVISNEYLPLRDVVFNTLRQAIITGEFAPGERLVEISLSQSLGVSRTPVREAIRKLELEGLVVMVPRKGAYVASITEQSLRDVLEVRIVLELFAVKLACERIHEAGIRELESLHRDFTLAVVSNDQLDIAQKDEQFHDAIFRAGGNKRLISIINNLREQFYRYRLEYVRDIPSHKGLVQEHEALIAAIRERNADKAQRLMRQHLENQQNAVIQAIRIREKDHPE